MYRDDGTMTRTLSAMLSLGTGGVGTGDEPWLACMQGSCVSICLATGACMQCKQLTSLPAQKRAELRE